MDDPTGLFCPECGGQHWKVMQTAASAEYGGCIWRRRKCKDCGALVHTYEMDQPTIDALDFEGG